MFVQHLPRGLALAGLLALTSLMTSAAWGASPVVSGDYSIYFNANTAANLDPGIARQHGLERSKFIGLLNVTVLRQQSSGLPTNVPARVDASARTGSAETKTLAMREIRVGQTLSYIGQFPIHDQVTIDFVIEVKPAGETETTRIELSEQFFVD